MRAVLFAGLICALFLFYTINAAPADVTALAGEELTIVEQDAPLELKRQKRATCDLLGGLKHSACAAHCLLLGNRGGYCENRICHCRN